MVEGPGIIVILWQIGNYFTLYAGWFPLHLIFCIICDTFYSAFIKSATIIEVHKRDLMIKQLSNDLKKEREECKRKDSALQKYEAFYREVKARSAEKARLRQQLLEKEQQEKRLS